MAKGVVAKNGNNAASKSHPSYLEMISEAITTLKQRSGSSEVAIGKFIEDKYKSSLPPNFNKLLSVQLKKFTSSERLVKIGNSYKTQKVNPSTKGDKKTETEKKKGVKTKRLSQVKTPEALKKAVGKSGKMKRLSQVKTSDELHNKKKLQKTGK